MAAPLGTLKYLYLGTRDFDADARYYKDVVGAEQVWSFARFGARVAAYRVSDGPLLLIADHRPAPSCMPVFAVADLNATAADLRKRGWKHRHAVEIPDGPCFTFVDESGNELAVFGNVRPDALEQFGR